MHAPLPSHFWCGVNRAGIPSLHDGPAPQSVPSGLLVLSTQVCAPVLQEVTPTLQTWPGFSMQASPAVQSMQLALPLQTLFGPQDEPVALCMLSLHAIDPVAQLVMPVKQTFGLPVQVWFAVHAPQVPLPSQT